MIHVPWEGGRHRWIHVPWEYGWYLRYHVLFFGRVGGTLRRDVLWGVVGTLESMFLERVDGIFESMILGTWVVPQDPCSLGHGWDLRIHVPWGMSGTFGSMFLGAWVVPQDPCSLGHGWYLRTHVPMDDFLYHKYHIVWEEPIVYISWDET